MKLSKFAQQLIGLGYEIIFNPTEETIDVEGQFDSTETEEIIRIDIDNGKVSAWFMAEVRLKYKSIESHSEYLGACSYNSFDDFTGQDNDYFDDMLRGCLNNMENQLKELKSIELPKVK